MGDIKKPLNPKNTPAKNGLPIYQDMEKLPPAIWQKEGEKHVDIFSNNDHPEMLKVPVIYVIQFTLQTNVIQKKSPELPGFLRFNLLSEQSSSNTFRLLNLTVIPVCRGTPLLLHRALPLRVLLYRYLPVGHPPQLHHRGLLQSETDERC